MPRTLLLVRVRSRERTQIWLNLIESTGVDSRPLRDSDLTAWSGGHGSRVLSRERLGDLGREDRPKNGGRARSALQQHVVPGVLVLCGRFARLDDNRGVSLPNHPVASVYNKCGQGRFARRRASSTIRHSSRSARKGGGQSRLGVTLATVTV
jgi:hypothetical protein